MKAPSPLLGFNNNVRHKGRVFHIQTEDSGVKHPHVITHLFADGGRIVRSTKTSYAEYVGDEDMPRKVRALMQEQHKAMFIALRAGKFDHLLEGIPLADAQPGHRPPMESTLSIEVEGDKVAIPRAPQSNPGGPPPATSSSPGRAVPPPTPSTKGAAAPSEVKPVEAKPAPAVVAAAAADAAAPEAEAKAPSVSPNLPPPVPAKPNPVPAVVPTSAPTSTPTSAATSVPKKSPSIPPRNPDPSPGLRHLTPPPRAMPSVPPGPRPAPHQPTLSARPSVPPPLSIGPAGPATTRDSHSPVTAEGDRRSPQPPPLPRDGAPRSDPRAERAEPPIPPAAGSKPRIDTRVEPPPARRSGSLLATLGSGVPSAPKPPSLGATPASPNPLRKPTPPASSALSASLGAGLKPRSDAARELGNAPTQAMAAARPPAGGRAEVPKPPPPRGASGNSPSRPPMSSSLDLDLEALERAAEQGHSPVYRQVHDLPPPPAAVLRTRGTPASYRSLTPPQSGAQSASGAPASQGQGVGGRYAPSRPASIFGNARPQEGSSIFGEDLISEKSLDEVILSYLAEDLDAPPKK